MPRDWQRAELRPHILLQPTGLEVGTGRDAYDDLVNVLDALGYDADFLEKQPARC